MPRHFTARMKRSRGQSLVETALMLPILLIVVLNVINLAYFFLVVVNLTGAARTGTLYSIEGSYTPFASSQPTSGPTTDCASSPNTVACLVYQDMTGALWNPSNSNNSVTVCTQMNVVSGSGLNAAGTLANCQVCSNSSCSATANPASQASDPEAPNFVANQVTISYQFTTLIPGTFFNAALQSIPGCSGGTCTFVRTATMRSMGP